VVTQTPRNLKREARIAYIEVIKEDPVSVIAIIFRGCWMDGMLIATECSSVEDIKGWLGGSEYFLELSGIAFGEAIVEYYGSKGLEDLESWMKESGKGTFQLGQRNLKQAQVIVDGVSSFLRERLKSPI
jgi:hypothetical protein